jgi:crotonobetainyl-CoA dehydrogenase
MDFSLDDDQQLMVQTVGELMARENWESYFQTCEEQHEYPERFVAELAALGVDSILLPEDRGGMASGWVTLAAVWAELGRLGAPTYVLYQLPAWDTILREGTEEQIDKIMAYQGTGKQVWNSAMTEPGAGSGLGALQTTYTRRDGKVYLSGHKTFITSSAHVPFLVVMSRDSAHPETFTEWFVDMSLPGITKEPLEKLGLRMDSCCEIYFDDVELEEKDLFGTEGRGFARGVDDFDFERFLVACSDFGMACCALEDAAKYANEREQGGEKIARYQLTQEKFCNMQIRVTNMRNMLFEIAWKFDNNLLGRGDCSMAKYYCARASFDVVDDALQVFGGLGITGNHRVARFWRDLRVDRVSGGTDEMMILTSGRAVLKEYR